MTFQNFYRRSGPLGAIHRVNTDFAAPRQPASFHEMLADVGHLLLHLCVCLPLVRPRAFAVGLGRASGRNSERSVP
jgi:hypothetical protein